MRSRYNFDPILNPNAITIAPNGDNWIIQKYEELIARTDMGTLSATNRRVFVLTPGTYNITQLLGWAIDTDYIDVVALGDDPDSVIVTSALSVAGGKDTTQTVEITAQDFVLSGFTIRNTIVADKGHAMHVTATSSLASIYNNMRWRHSSPGVGRDCIKFIKNIDHAGTFINCEGDDNMWVAGGDGATPRTYNFNMTNCKGSGDGAFFGNAQGSHVTGTIRDCEFTGLAGGVLGTQIKDGFRAIGSTFSTSEALMDTFEVMASGPVFERCKILVVQGSTGIPINDDGNAWNVQVSHCVMNNASNDADGLGPNLTNLLGTNYNIVDDDASL